jgi:hypothetical protein
MHLGEWFTLLPLTSKLNVFDGQALGVGGNMFVQVHQLSGWMSFLHGCMVVTTYL